ncbi:hypothetical protein AOQ84DRAFT_165288 [Glonium stellatum]|uniref:Uncharacterized protein n=1 Tax=Glonium stellatum TaxID=574774 RepID=A0A8E2ER94_9PEZI|nr:hypothetical protein AOQ84DRAFT_165288 [Glonium stellatum]
MARFNVTPSARHSIDDEETRDPLARSPTQLDRQQEHSVPQKTTYVPHTTEQPHYTPTLYPNEGISDNARVPSSKFSLMPTLPLKYAPDCTLNQPNTTNSQGATNTQQTDPRERSNCTAIGGVGPIIHPRLALRNAPPVILPPPAPSTPSQPPSTTAPEPVSAPSSTERSRRLENYLWRRGERRFPPPPESATVVPVIWRRRGGISAVPGGSMICSVGRCFDMEPLPDQSPSLSDEGDEDYEDEWIRPYSIAGKPL